MEEMAGYAPVQNPVFMIIKRYSFVKLSLSKRNRM